MADDFIRVHFLPIAVFIALPATFLTSFAIAVGLGHVEADFPYISDTGTKSPESCIFGQLLNIVAVLTAVNFYVRFKQVEHFLSNHDNMQLQRTNHIALYVGLSTSLGMSMVGNFQETNVLAVHLIGAVLAFGVGWVYVVMQTVLSYKTQPYLSSLMICHLRAVLCVLIAITFIGTMAFAVVAHLDFDGKNYPPEWLPTDAFTLDAIAKQFYHGKNPRKWYPQDGGFTYHVLSTTSEWIMATCLLIFFVSFVKEFRHLRMTPPRVTTVELSNSGLITDDDVPIIA